MGHAPALVAAALFIAFAAVATIRYLRTDAHTIPTVRRAFRKAPVFTVLAAGLVVVPLLTMLLSIAGIIYGLADMIFGSR